MLLIICQYIQGNQFPPNDTEFCETLTIHVRFDLFTRCLDGEVVSVLGPLRSGTEFAPGQSFCKFLAASQQFRLIIGDKISEVFFPLQLHPIYTPPHLPEFCFEFATVYWIECAHQPTSGQRGKTPIRDGLLAYGFSLGIGNVG